MNDANRKHTRSKLLDVFVICCLVLLPGIRGYDNWRPYEYLFLLIPVAGIIYQWIKESNSVDKKN